MRHHLNCFLNGCWWWHLRLVCESKVPLVLLMKTSQPIIWLITTKAVLGSKRHQHAQHVVIVHVVKKNIKRRAQLLAIHVKLHVAPSHCASVRQVDGDALPERGMHEAAKWMRGEVEEF